MSNAPAASKDATPSKQFWYYTAAVTLNWTNKYSWHFGLSKACCIDYIGWKFIPSHIICAT